MISSQRTSCSHASSHETHPLPLLPAVQELHSHLMQQLKALQCALPRPASSTTCSDHAAPTFRTVPCLQVRAQAAAIAGDAAVATLAQVQQHFQRVGQRARRAHAVRAGLAAHLHCAGASAHTACQAKLADLAQCPTVHLGGDVSTARQRSKAGSPAPSWPTHGLLADHSAPDSHQSTSDNSEGHHQSSADGELHEQQGAADKVATGAMSGSWQKVKQRSDIEGYRRALTLMGVKGLKKRTALRIDGIEV